MDRQLGESSPAAFGDLFKRARLRRHLTLSDAAVATKIRASILEAIEVGDVARFPSPVFAIGLIRSYARFLQCDGEPYANLFRVSIAEREQTTSSPLQGPIHSRSSARPRYVVTVTFAIVLVLLAGYLYQQYEAYVVGAVSAQSRPLAQTGVIFTPLPTPPTAPTVVATSVAPIAAATPTTEPTLAPTPTLVLPTETALPIVTTVHGVRIDAQTTGRVWVQVETDGTVAFVGIINAGETRTWNATDKLLIWSGNGGNVLVTFNGKPLGPLGAPGEVVKVTWTATN